MKKKHTAQSVFFNLCILLGLLIFFAGIGLALVAATDPQSSTRDVTRNRNAQVPRADRGPTTPSGAVQEAWVARYNGPTNEYDEGQAIAVDASGNVYVTGYSGEDYVTIKYDTSGQEQWVARYNGGSGRAIAVDSSGNVYVTGQSVLSGGSLDYATIKYDSAGKQQWVARYNGPASDYDSASSIVVDSSGNVYVTGESLGLGTGLDYATIKYNSAGQQQWVARYNGLGNGDDYAAYAGAIVLDGSGNVYVTGGSAGSGTSDDYATIKYNSLGQEQWAARYDGPGHDFDRANAIAIDGSSNVYVTGRSYGSGTGLSDCATIKYLQPTPRVTPRPRPSPAPRP